MSSLCKDGITTINENNSSPTPILRENLNPCNNLLPVKLLQIADFIKRISLLILPKTAVKASMTVETALVLPLFCFFMIHMGSAIEMIRLHGNLEVALWDAGRQVGIYGGILDGEKDRDKETADAGDWIGTVAVSYTYVKNQIRNQLGEEYLEQSPLEDGIDGLQFLESNTEDDCFDIVVTYGIRPLTESLGFRKFRMVNRYYGHLWNGYRIPVAEEKEEYVYVTRDSQVYHTNRECTHLRLSICRVEEAQIPRGYRPCEKCVVHQKDAFSLGDNGYYICTDGEHYHRRRDCPGLKRTVLRISRKEASGYRECSRCGKYRKQENG